MQAREATLMEELTQKERLMLEQQLGHEKVCVQKYRDYASRASPGIRGIFYEIASHELDHCDLIEGLLAGQNTRGSGRKTAGGRYTAAPLRGVAAPDPITQFQRWRGPKPAAKPTGDETVREKPPGGPISVPFVMMEAAEEWDGVDLSPWANLTSPPPLDRDAGQPTTINQIDRAMLADMMVTERFLSGAYDSASFDSYNPEVRRILRQIQRDEQRHGDRIALLLQE